MTRPVVVDFWADWCEPCKQLMPILEKLATEYQGAFLLAKVNADEQQMLAQQLGVRSLPTVMVIKDGQPIDGFSGAQPESAVREMLDKHLPSPQAGALAEAEQLLADGDIPWRLGAVPERVGRVGAKDRYDARLCWGIGDCQPARRCREPVKGCPSGGSGCPLRAADGTD
jgi:thioredoxin